DRVEQRGLAGAVRAHEPDDRPLVDGQRDGVERHDAAELHGHVAGLEHGHRIAHFGTAPAGSGISSLVRAPTRSLTHRPNPRMPSLVCTSTPRGSRATAMAPSPKSKAGICPTVSGGTCRNQTFSPFFENCSLMISGNTAIATPPRKAPTGERTPQVTTTAKNSSPLTTPQVVASPGRTVNAYMANNVPPRPARKAPIANATTFAEAILIPNVAEAGSLVRMAANFNPSVERRRLTTANAQTTKTTKTT